MLKIYNSVRIYLHFTKIVIFYHALIILDTIIYIIYLYILFVSMK